LNGSVDANNLLSDVQFEYGQSINYGNTINANPGRVKGINNSTVNVQVSNLLPATTYHFRAKATNAVDETLGNDLSFTTSNPILLITTNPIINITSTSAIAGGYVSNSGLNLISRGVCWNAASNPTIANNITSEGVDTGTFVSQLNNLIPNTIYYLRAYATNSFGTEYGNELIFSTANTPIQITDIDGNIYNTVEIGTQTWFKENLKTSKLNNGTLIPKVTNNALWSGLTTSAFCWYNNDSTINANIYGALYNWHSVNSNLLCPNGWHVPSDFDWTALSAFLGGNAVAGNKLKEVGSAHWPSTNTGATDEFGFSALPAGYRNDVGTFEWLGNAAYFFSSSINTSNCIPFCSKFIGLGGNNAILYFDYGSPYRGYSVRCIKD